MIICGIICIHLGQQKTRKKGKASMIKTSVKVHMYADSNCLSINIITAREK